MFCMRTYSIGYTTQKSDSRQFTIAYYTIFTCVFFFGLQPGTLSFVVVCEYKRKIQTMQEPVRLRVV